MQKGEPDHSKSCDIFEYPIPSFKVDLPFFPGGKQRKDKIFGQKSQTEHDQRSFNQYPVNYHHKLFNLSSRSRKNSLALSKTSGSKGYEQVQSKQRASTSNEYEVINPKLVLKDTKPGDLTSTGVVSSARRAQPPITASINRNVAGCSAGPSEQQIISTLKDCKITSSTTNSDEERIGGKSTSSNGAGDTPTNETAGQSEIPEIETALNNPAEVDKFLEFLNQQYCSENLYFYFAVQKYKAIAPDDAKGRCDIGNQIFERHFAQNCNEPVNVEYATNKAICEAKKANNFQPETYDHAQYQIFHLLKYDVWPRYIRSEAEKRPPRGVGENDVSSEHTETSSTSTSYRKFKNFFGRKLQPCGGEGSKAKRPSVRELRYCLVLSADSVSSEKEVLDDPLISVKRWTETMAQRRGMDKNSTEVVDAQTGSTIDPARQAIDALNNRHVRLMPVVRFPVDFLAQSASSKNSSPTPAKVVMLRVRQGLTLIKVLRPLLIKYNFDPNDIVTCFAGTCDPIHLSTTVASITPRMVTVMTQQQFKDRKLLPKREYQKELCASPILAQNQELNFPYFQHGDIAFYELPTEADAKGQKHSAIRSHSTNPRFQELFKFGRKASQAKSKSDNEGNIAGGGSGGGGEVLLTNKPSGGSDRRKSIGTSGRGPPQNPISIAPSDIPYCGEVDDSLLNTSRSSASPKLLKNKPMSAATSSSSSRPQQSLSKEGYQTNDIKIVVAKGGVNGNAPRVPAIYASTVRSDKEATSPSDTGADKISWYADYV
uniref:RGS domain-containing protein n=1 Tax=Panagrolaimus sp. ES5 TaxID=591445 RepID=A0AC34F786_9BILA